MNRIERALQEHTETYTFIKTGICFEAFIEMFNIKNSLIF